MAPIVPGQGQKSRWQAQVMQVRLKSLRSRFFNHIDSCSMEQHADALSTVARKRQDEQSVVRSPAEQQDSICVRRPISATPVTDTFGGSVPQLLRTESYSEPVTKVEPLSLAEDALWRAIMRIVKVLPRHLDSDLLRGVGVSASEYTTMMHLSEAPNRELRMSDLASATGLSPSRMTRLVDDLQSRSLVTKVASSSDARGNVARLTSRGMAKLKAAWPVHLASVRARFFDHMETAEIKLVAAAMSGVADHLEDG
jgi:DNA-binding MarR family transcriptional regulator